MHLDVRNNIYTAFPTLLTVFLNRDNNNQNNCVIRYNPFPYKYFYSLFLLKKSISFMRLTYK